MAGLMTAGAVAEIEGRKVTKKEALVAGLTGLASGALSGAISGMTGILTPKKIFEYQWLGNIAVAGIAAGLAADGSARDRVDAALNDMPIAKANSSRKNNTSRTSVSSSSKSGYSERWLVSVEWKYTGSGKFCWEICTKRYSDGSISVERWKYAT